MMIIIGLDGQIKKLVTNGGVLDLSNTSANYVPESRILTINGVSYDLSADRTWTVTGGSSVELQSTGVFTGGVISIGAGGAGVATTFSITAGTGQIVDNTVDPTTVTPVSWTAQTNVAVTNILTNLVTFVAIDSGGNVIQSTTDFTPVQMREYIVLGVVVHSNQTTVNAVNQAQIVAYNQGNQLTDLFYSIGLFNVTGNVFSANGANLKIDKSAGSIFRRGSNYTSLTDNPHIVTTGALVQGSLRMQNQTGAGSASTTDIDVANYDVGGVTTAISPATRFSVLRIYLFQSNLIAVQRGQATYQSLAEAKAAIQTETYVTNSILEANGLLRGFLCVRANATDLTNASQAFFIDAGKFGGSSGVGGLSVSTLQNAYDNSSTPEIVTDSTRGAVSVRRGSAADTDSVIEVLNGAGSTVATITGEGNVTVLDEAYGVGWNGSLEVPTKNAVYDKIETLGGSGTVTDFIFTDGGGFDGTVSTSTTTPTLSIALQANNNFVTDAEKTVIGNTSGTNTGNETTSTLGVTINGAAAATPNDTDLVATVDTSVVKKITWTNVKSFLKTYFDSIYQAAGSYLTSANISDAAYGVGWDGDTTTAPSKNAIYDKIQTMGGTGTVTDFVFTDGGGFDGTVATSTTTPTLSIALQANNNFVTDAEKTVIGNTSGTNTGDQTSIVGITGTTAQFNTANTDGDFATLAGAESLTNKKLGSLTTNGFVKTGSGDGTLSVDTTTYLPNTATAGVAASPTATQTDTITHGLGRTPVIIRIEGMSQFTSNAAATPTPSSRGIWCSSGNRCIFQPYAAAAITTTQNAATSTTFAVYIPTSNSARVEGVIQNVTSTTFDIAWTETGTAAAKVYMWEAQ